MIKTMDRLQRRSRAVGFVIAVVYKFVDDRGNYLAALITYYTFVSLFPLLLLLTTVLGVVLDGHPALQQQILHSAMNQLPVIGKELEQPQRLSGGTIAVVVGIAGALYGALWAGQAIQFAMDTVWAVPRNVRPNPVRARLRSVLLLSVLGSALIATTVLAALGRASTHLGPVTKASVVATAACVNAAVCMVGFRLSTARDVNYSQLLPGAVVAAVAWQALQWFGAVYVHQVMKSANVTNTVFATVLGLLAFLYLVALTLVMCAEVNVVLAKRLFPRALLSPMTDDAAITGADRETYAAQAKAQRAKSFEQIDVTFTRDNDNRDA